ncbi:hypothetical protein CC86DRAFT_395879 [Ophiobolus disseminans]|uniref:Proteophosphoglycan 5 n=1 Tax=Ophiobolus disseminans TaxID=1469910 RepID=A0A6A6ZS09_9PLEO|nr:hypothetical protein CC86DRAFT_395879 [Ophiobolus disseminans]
MSSAQVTASPRAPRGKQQPPPGAPAQAPQANGNNGRQGQRRPRGGRAQSGGYQAGASPSRQPRNADPTLAESAAFSSEDAQLPHGPRNPKKHTQSQPSVDRMFSPNGAQASLTDTENATKPIAATPAKNQGAYAGPTFHASPAPSALPIPKFLSRSVPAKSRMDPPTPPPEESSESGGSPSPLGASPSRGPISVPPRNEMSPLDLLFKADRAERAKIVQGSPASNNYFNSANPVRPEHYKHDSFGSLNAPFPVELDGEARHSHMSPPPHASPMALRSVTDPNKVPQLKDASQPTNNDVMQDLMNRLSMSQKKSPAATPPRPRNESAPRDGTPSPFQDGRSATRSASGPSTPVPAAQENPDFFYGNRNLSPLFKAAKHDPSKRNSGLRTEITADSPLIEQGIHGPEHILSQLSGRPGQQPRPDSYPSKINASGPGFNPSRAGTNGAPASVKKPATSMMSFVPSSVAAKKHSSSTLPSTVTPPPVKAPSASTPPDTLALEQDLKRLLNLQSAEDASGAR